MRRPLLIAAGLTLSVALPVKARAGDDGKALMIVSSFPKAVTEVYRRAFEAAHRGVAVRVEKKKITAGLRDLQKGGGTGAPWISSGSPPPTPSRC